MTRLKDEVIEDTSKLGDIIELCEDEIKQFSKYEDHIEVLADYKDDIINKIENKCNKVIAQI